MSVLRWKSRKKNCGGDAHHSRRTREMEEITCAVATTTPRFLSHQAILIDIVENGAAAPAAVERQMRCYRFIRRLCKRLPHAADEAGNNFCFHFYFLVCVCVNKISIFMRRRRFVNEKLIIIYIFIHFIDIDTHYTTEKFRS